MEIKPKQVTWDQITKGWYVQPKYDGECNKLIIKNGKARLVRFEGREKTEFYPEIIEYANELDLHDMVLVGEICVLLDEYKASFPHIQLRMNTVDKDKQKKAMKDKLATFMVFDIEEYDGENLDNMNYKDRYKKLDGLFQSTWIGKISRIMTVNNLDPIEIEQDPRVLDWEMFVKEHEMEGIVVKNPNHTNEWVKLKNFDEDDFTIVGTELKAEGKARGWFISKLNLEDINGTHVDKGMTFDCKYINYPQTEQAKQDVFHL
jgi:bifunctional non-homologous end joining protein LigD